MLDLLKFDITANGSRAFGVFRDLQAELRGVKGALAGVQDYATRAGRSMRNIGAGMSATVTAPLMLLGKQSVQLYDQQVRAENAVAQAILSTGSAAGLTLQDLKGLASGLQGVTTYGDEDILQNVTAPLLTFTKVQGDVFGRAQANVLDMATLLKMDLKSASVLVGKALNDPIKGVTALSRSGVQFTEDQKKVIKSLVEMGDVAGAQTVILKELETQFGGQAAAAATAPLGQWRQLGNLIGDVKEQLGEQIVPFLKPLVESVKEAVDWFGALSPEVKKNVVIFGGIAAVAGPVLGFLGLAALGVGTLAGAFTAMGAALLANPIMLVIASIAAGAYLIYANWNGISGWFADLWSRVSDGASSGWQIIKAKLSEYTPEWLKTAWGNLGVWFTEQWRAVQGSVSFVWGEIKALLSGDYSPEELLYKLWRGIGAWFAGLAPELTAAFVALWEAIKAEVSTWPDKFVQIGVDMIEGLQQGILQKWADIKATVSDLANQLPEWVKGPLGIQSPSREFMAIGNNVGEGLQIGIQQTRDSVMAEVRSMAQGVLSEASGTLDLLGTVRDGAKSIFRDVLTGAKSFRGALGDVLSGWGNRLLDAGINGLFDAIWPFAKGGVVSGGSVTAFANGGVVSAPTFFGMRGGLGLMGEAGPEAILPLARASDGKLGVRAQGGGGGGRAPVTLNFAPVIDARGADAAAVSRIEAQQRAMAQNFTELVGQALRSGRMHRADGFERV